MKIINIEPTPSPNTMKVVLDEEKNEMKSETYTSIEDTNPIFINALLEIEEVTSIFYALNFVSIDKHPKAEWKLVIPKIEETMDRINNSINDKSDHDNTDTHSAQMHQGNEDNTTQTMDLEFKVELLTFKEIPYQIKLSNRFNEERIQLSERFLDAVETVTLPHDNVIFMRQWIHFDDRYGNMNEEIDGIREEIEALYSDKQLDDLIKQAKETEYTVPKKEMKKVTLSEFEAASDWKERLRMLDHFPTPDESDYELLAVALQDEKAQVRRFAVVLLGMIEQTKTLKYLDQALDDKNVSVRRTAGDCISDLGYKEALPIMERALSDKSKLVRWRAAMFIYDEGNSDQLKTLHQHVDDDAYEVALQVKMAIHRIEGGEDAKGSVWKQISNRNNTE